MRLSFFTFGILRGPWGDPKVQGFLDRVPDIFDTAEGADGFVDRSRPAREGDADRWGEQEVPKFAEGREDCAAQTLSVWEDVEPVFSFAYQGVHSEALRRARQWTEEGDYSSHTAWWIDEDHWPTWSEACERHLHLCEIGVTSHAFTLREAFDSEGERTKPDAAKINEHHSNSRR